MPQQENRKIIRIGKTSLGVILPRAWLRFFSLSAGDEVEVVSNGHIIVKPVLKATSQSCTVTPKEST
ncbi:AbrB/MazE/SpoVT family DNA-binding domain-containing protein [Candidatus Bathyarchaeota archaeon A05DMB-2]|nr:AbrB/MazE/SpoVT family DNA-binding domain-containing protein [Candidatus Bathyarchaeota archaeon A05DMB-2]